MKKTVFKLVLASAAIACSIFAATEISQASDRNRVIADGVYFGDIAAGGMTEVEATEAIEARVAEAATTTIELDASELAINAKASDFGMEWANKGMVKDALNIGVTGSIIERYKSEKDLANESVVYDIEYSFDQQKIEDFVSKNTSAMDIDPINAKLSREDGRFVIEDGINGVKVDAKESAKTIAADLSNGWSGENRTYTLACQVKEPKITAEQLGRVKEIIGTYTTDYSSSASGRAANVANGAKLINGALLFPGDQLSVQDRVKPFTPENGYQLAGSYENGTTVQTYGGGICQVSTTLYNAVIRAELQVDSRYCHSMIVGYVQPSMDAAIADGLKDFKFTNNYDFPIYVEGYTSGGRITFNIYGEETRPSNRSISFESETTSTTQPETKFTLTSDLPLGSTSTEQGSHTGYTARLWKVVKVDGNVESREIFNTSVYNASPRIVLVGTAGANESALSALRSAISSGSEDTVRSTASNLKNQKDTGDDDKKDDSNNNNNNNDNNNNNNNNDNNNKPDDTSKPDDGGQKQEDDSSAGSQDDGGATDDGGSDDYEDGSDSEDDYDEV